MSRDWIACADRLPASAGPYPVFAPSADPAKPLRTVAWYEPSGGEWPSGWSGLVREWYVAVTHWMEWPEDPVVKP